MVFGRENIVYGQQGIDTIELMAKYKSFNNPNPVKKERIGMVQTLGLEAVKKLSGTPVYEEVKRIKKRAKKDGLNAIVEVFKLSKGRSLSAYVLSVKNVGVSLEYDRVHKKSKNTHCVLVFAGLHQPTKRLHVETMRSIKKFTDRKTFYVSSLEIASDVTDKKSINSRRKESFKKLLKPHAKRGVISKGSSLYLNHPQGLGRVAKVLLYDKYLKQSKTQKQELALSLKHWKRVEDTIIFDLSKKENRMSFNTYVKSQKFLEDLDQTNQIVKKLKYKEVKYDYLNYQLNSLLDARIMNNKESNKQFNSLEALKRFENSDFRVYALELLL
jgi:hypothetical protein